MKKLFERIFIESLKDDMDQYERDAYNFENKRSTLDYIGQKPFLRSAILGSTNLSIGGYGLHVNLSFNYIDTEPEDRTISDAFFKFYTKGENSYNKTCMDNKCAYDDFTEDVLVQHLECAYGDIDRKEIEPYLDEAMEQIENMAQKSWEKWQYKIKTYPKRFDNINNIVKKKNKDFDNRLSDLKRRYLVENPFAIGAKIRDEYNPRELWIVDDIDEENDIIYLRAPEEGIERWIYIDNDEKPPRKGTVFADGQKVIDTERASGYVDAGYLLRAEPGTIIKRKLSDVKRDYFEKPTNFKLKKAKDY